MSGPQQTPVTGAPGTQPCHLGACGRCPPGVEAGTGEVVVASSGRSRGEEELCSEQGVPGVRPSVRGNVTVPPCALP